MRTPQTSDAANPLERVTTPDASPRLSTESLNLSLASPRLPNDAGVSQSVIQNGAINFGSFDNLYGTTAQLVPPDQTNRETATPTDVPPSIQTPPSAAPESSVAAGAPAVDAAGANASAPTDVVTGATCKPSGVDQSLIGDCFFESGLASMANSAAGQKALQDMIKPNSDGSYTVTFPGDKTHPVTVSAADLQQNRDNHLVGDSGAWAGIVETAFLKYDKGGEYGTGINSWQSDNIPKLAKVSNPAEALQLLTGQSVATDGMGAWRYDSMTLTAGQTSEANIARNLTTAFQNGQVVTASAESSLQSDLGVNDSGPMVGNHAYSVLSFDPKSDTVVVRNPWGHNKGTAFENPGVTKDGITSLPDGELSMSLDTFTKRFVDVNIAGASPYSTDAQNVGYDIGKQMHTLSQLTSDVRTGNLSQVGGDASTYVHNVLTTDADALYGVTHLVQQGIADGVDKVESL